MANADLLSANPVSRVTRQARGPAYACVVETLDTPAFRWKAWIDRLIAALMLIPGLPMIGLLVAAIKLTSKGPGIYRQVRVGKGGRIFTMYKLRSMRVDAEAGSGPVWASLKGDSRVTPLGYWLRRLHLDELPQLFNVLKGDMSLVGPRPERPEFVKVLADKIDGYLDRLQVAPGITGLAQINLPPDTDLDSVRRKLLLDCEYICEAGFLLDLRIIACTLLRVVGLRGGRAVNLLGLRRSVPDRYTDPSAPQDAPRSVYAVAAGLSQASTLLDKQPPREAAPRHACTCQAAHIGAACESRLANPDNVEASLG